MRLPLLTLAAAALLGAGCATATLQPRESLSSVAPPTNTAAADAAPAATASRDAQLALGERVFESLCTACHTLEPPYQVAPPMTHIARHYRQAFADRDSAAAHLAAFVRAPSAERSKMPPHAIERFGLMPPVALADAELDAVALYVLSLPEPAPHSH
jgi:mono/diheme cytochrome c family protein